MINTSNEWRKRKTRKVSVGIFKDMVYTILEVQLYKMMPQENSSDWLSFATTNLTIATSCDVQECPYSPNFLMACLFFLADPW